MVATQIGVNEYKGVPLDVFYWQSDKHGWDNAPVPNKPGVYVISAFSSEGLWLGFEVKARTYYVGQTSDLQRRYCNHEIIKELQEDVCDVIRFSYMPLINPTPAFLRDIECVLIGIYKPCYNKQHNKNRGYEDSFMDKFDR